MSRCQGLHQLPAQLQTKAYTLKEMEIEMTSAPVCCRSMAAISLASGPLKLDLGSKVDVAAPMVTSFLFQPYLQAIPMFHLAWSSAFLQVDWYLLCCEQLLISRCRQHSW